MVCSSVSPPYRGRSLALRLNCHAESAPASYVPESVISPFDISPRDHLQKKQVECLGVVRKPPVFVITRIGDSRTTCPRGTSLCIPCDRCFSIFRGGAPGLKSCGTSGPTLPSTSEVVRPSEVGRGRLLGGALLILVVGVPILLLVLVRCHLGAGFERLTARYLLGSTSRRRGIVFSKHKVYAPD